MTNINFVLHEDCEIPCLHLVISENDKVLSDSEAYLPDYANIIPENMLIEYSNTLGNGFIKIFDIIKEADYNINVFNDKIQDMIAISKKKTHIDSIIKSRQQESENNNV